MSKPKDFLFVKAEYGAHFHVWYWQVRILFNSDDEALLTVKTPAKEFNTKLVREQVTRVKDFIRQINFLALPATNYDVDLSDDCTYYCCCCPTTLQIMHSLFIVILFHSKKTKQVTTLVSA